MYTKDGFFKALEQKIGDDAYILLAGGGTKKLADLLESASLGVDGNATTLSIKVAGTTKTSSVNVPYASNAAKWASAITLTIGSTGKSVNGSANVSWSLAEIGAAAAGHTHTLKLGNTTMTIAASGTTNTYTAISGPLAVDTNADSAKAFSVRRGSDGEGVKHWVDDSQYHIDYTNDETSSSIHIRIINTDTESPHNPLQTTDYHYYLDCYGQIYPGSNNSGSIGTSSYKWANMYATTFHGSLDGNASTATSASKWTKARTLTIGSTGKSVNGSANVSWSLAEIGAAASGHNHDSRYLRKDTNDSTGYQYTFSKTGDHAIQIGTIRGYGVGSCTGNYLHIYERVHIGSPSGWGSRNAPSYGLSTYGGAWLATDTGSVGVGTTSPQVKFHVSGALAVIDDSCNTTYDALAYFRHYSNNDWGLIVDKSQSYTYGLDIRAGGAYALKVANGNTRLIGATIIGADTTPSYTLDVRGNIRSTSRIYANEWIEFSGNTGLYWPNTYGSHFFPNQYTSYGNLCILGSKGGYTGILLGSSTSGMNLMDSGTHKGLYEQDQRWLFYYNRDSQKVGIRDSNTTKDINLIGQTYISSNTWIGTTSGGEMLNIGGWVGTTGACGWYSLSYGGGIYMEDSTYVRTYNGKNFYVSSGDTYAIYTAGSFATAKSGGCFAMYNGSSWYTDIFYNHWNGNLSFDAPGGSLFLAYYRGNIYFVGGSYYIDRSGYVHCNQYYTSSDRTKKTNIEILSEHIRKFTFKDTNKDAYGVIAQEVPDMFREGEEGNMTVNYNSVLSYYIGLLENKVKNLEETNKKLLEFIEKTYGKII